jgi:hypothetical protein
MFYPPLRTRNAAVIVPPPPPPPGGAVPSFSNDAVVVQAAADAGSSKQSPLQPVPTALAREVAKAQNAAAVPTTPGTAVLLMGVEDRGPSVNYARGADTASPTSPRRKNGKRDRRIHPSVSEDSSVLTLSSPVLTLMDGRMLNSPGTGLLSSASSVDRERASRSPATSPINFQIRSRALPLPSTSLSPMRSPSKSPLKPSHESCTSGPAFAFTASHVNKLIGPGGLEQVVVTPATVGITKLPIHPRRAPVRAPRTAPASLPKVIPPRRVSSAGTVDTPTSNAARRVSRTVTQL